MNANHNTNTDTTTITTNNNNNNNRHLVLTTSDDMLLLFFLLLLKSSSGVCDRTMTARDIQATVDRRAASTNSIACGRNKKRGAFLVAQYDGF